MKIRKEQMQDVLYKLFRKYEFSESKALALAEVHTENTLHGVNSHGVNRVPHFIEAVEKGIVKVDTEAQKAESFGSIERWDGHLGAGVLNAIICTNRAVELAMASGIGLVALRNTNHWMRAGYYGWQATDKGCIAILFTNTKPNMPAWGGQENSIGNNPFVVSIPRAEGHVVLDMALSQFSFGKIHEYKLQGKQLPYPGGWDADNVLTNDPGKILSTGRVVPTGYWKGSALSMVLDMLATLLSAGNSTAKMSETKYETGISQVFLCLNPDVFHDKALGQNLLNEIIAYTRDPTPSQTGGNTYYPGERSMQAKNMNLKNGMEVHPTIWQDILDLLG